jgi:molecular chaperone DnaJ
MRIDSELDAYRELGVPPGASAEAIRQAYLALARQYHPDRAPTGRAAEYEERMKRINTAYALLRDPESRRQYDRLRAPQTVPSHATPRAPTAPRAQPNDPYTQMRAGYQQRVYRVQASTRALPAWAQALSGLFAGLGLVAGFLLGLPFGIVGCIPGAMVGMVVGMLVGLWVVYVLALGLPTALLGWLGLLLADTVGMWVGGGMGLALGMWWARRLWQRTRITYHSR